MYPFCVQNKIWYYEMYFLEHFYGMCLFFALVQVFAW